MSTRVGILKIEIEEFFFKSPAFSRKYYDLTKTVSVSALILLTLVFRRESVIKFSFL